MSTHLVAPREKRLELTDGDYLIVKERLNAGETIDMFERGAPNIDLTEPGAAHKISASAMGMAIVSAYLLDWSLTDFDNAIIPIRGLSPDAIETTVRDQDFDTCVAIMNAIAAHDAAQRSKKKAPELASVS